MLKKDQYIVGLTIGILTPLLLFGLIFGINYLIVVLGLADVYIDFQTHVFISLFGNLLPIRYYFVTLTYDKTGRGVLVITFAVIMLFFIFKESLF